MSAMLLLCSTNIQSFVYDKSCSTLQLIKGETSDPRKLLKYLRGMVASPFKVGTSGCAGRLESLSRPNYAGLASVFPVLFVL